MEISANRPMPRNKIRHPKESLIKIPSGTPNAIAELKPIKIIPIARALYSGATIFGAIVKESTTISPVLIAANTLDTINVAKLGLK